jgi:hypothetical protein
MTLISTRPRRFAAAALLSAVIGAATLLSLSPPNASAGYGQCRPGDFCLLWDLSIGAGIYHNSGSDWNLNNDRFERNHTHTRVGNRTTAAANFGHRGAYDDVIVYDETGGHRPFGCIKRGHNGQLPLAMFSRIESFQWASNSACKAVGVIYLPGSIKP